MLPMTPADDFPALQSAPLSPSSSIAHSTVPLMPLPGTTIVTAADVRNAADSAALALFLVVGTVFESREVAVATVQRHSLLLVLAPTWHICDC